MQTQTATDTGGHREKRDRNKQTLTDRRTPTNRQREEWTKERVKQEKRDKGRRRETG